MTTRELSPSDTAGPVNKPIGRELNPRDGGIIFPHWDYDGPSKPGVGGVTLRDLFAMAVLTGMIRAEHRLQFDPKDDAAWAYKLADQMLLERAKS